MTDAHPWARAAVAAAVLAALYAALHMLATLWVAKSLTPAPPAPVPWAAHAPPSAPPPLRGTVHALQAAPFGGGSFYVLRNREAWKRSAAAQACFGARAYHELVVQRYADMTPAARAAAGGDVLGELPSTLATLRWAQSPADDPRVDAAAADVVETIRQNGATYYFGFVAVDQPVAPQVLAVLQRLLPTPLQRAQLSALMGS